MSLSLTTISNRTNITSRRLRSVLDHQLVPGLNNKTRHANSTRRLDPFESFAVAVAAAMLGGALSRRTVKRLMASLSGATRSRSRTSLWQRYQDNDAELWIGDATLIWYEHQWYLPPKWTLVTHVPLVETAVQLGVIRNALDRTAD
jgi:hypothetical protein